MVWGNVKNWVDQKHESLKLDDAIQLESVNANSTTAQECASYCNHVVDQEEQYSVIDMTNDTQTDKIIINLQETKSSNSCSNSSLEDELLDVEPLL
jgi:hypothetical protein